MGSLSIWHWVIVIGVVLLLFMIGLELSFERLWVMRRLVFGLGSLQVALCATVLAGAALLLTGTAVFVLDRDGGAPATGPGGWSPPAAAAAAAMAWPCLPEERLAM